MKKSWLGAGPHVESLLQALFGYEQNLWFLPLLTSKKVAPAMVGHLV